jgi:hypothetical protein
VEKPGEIGDGVGGTKEEGGGREVVVIMLGRPFVTGLAIESDEADCGTRELRREVEREGEAAERAKAEVVRARSGVFGSMGLDR